MKQLISFLTIAAFIFTFSGCAAITAIRHPSKKNLQVLNAGTSRENVITYLGAPINSEKNSGETVDVYKFVQGYSGGNKVTRATIHIVMDIFTLFIWEILAWPGELIFKGNEMAVKVVYDQEEHVKDVQYLKQG